MNDQFIKELKEAVEAVLFCESITVGKRLNGQHAFAQLMQALENATTSSNYSSGYHAGWKPLYLYQGVQIEYRGTPESGQEYRIAGRSKIAACVT